ncbi:hypothetical protein Taro_013373 [Colocasia esculenta]|uniref:Uncharacterized protein n=1 Tax=Colocasia esculenta TaxID=4460 RepID=A0A843UII9_COLES|nr:hypothetical protein [Colocasia esculenta]
MDLQLCVCRIAQEKYLVDEWQVMRNSSERVNKDCCAKDKSSESDNPVCCDLHCMSRTTFLFR